MTRRKVAMPQTPEESRAFLQANAPERDLQKHLEYLLSFYGWRHHHETDSRKSAAGWPDLVAVRIRDRLTAHGQPRYPWVLFLEVKSAKGSLRDEQAALWAELAKVQNDSVEIRCAVVRPSNLNEIEALIRGTV